MPHYNTLLIDLPAIGKNLEVFKRKNTRIMAMLKAQAYGTDPLILARFLNAWGVDMIGLSHVSEAVFLRENGIECSLFVIGCSLDCVSDIVKYDLEIAVSTESMIKALEKAAHLAQKKIKVHLDVNTGMHRFGCTPKEALGLADEIRTSSSLILDGVMTHFVASELKAYDGYSKEQIRIFNELAKTLSPPWVHAANSSGFLRFDLPFCNMARVGLALFGIPSSKDEYAVAPLTQALTLQSQIIGINECQKGDTVGYLRDFVVEKEKMRIAILPIGYHDGIHLRFSQKGYVLIHGKKAPYVGRICMDFMMVDITEIPEAKTGDTATIFGKELPPDLLSEFGGTNVRELLACLGPRVKRVFISSKIAPHLQNFLPKEGAKTF